MFLNVLVGCGDSTHRRKFDLDVIICKSLQVTKKGKASDFINLEEQASNSRAAVERLSEDAGNVAEAPPVADKARRCWRKTRSIAPAPRAIGDYVLRGLNGLQSKPHETVLFERSEFTGECAELPTE